MKRAFISLAAGALALSLAASVAAAPSAQSSSKSTAHRPSTKKQTPKLSKWQQHILDVLKSAAPGDEYFGRMKMSYLGINNTFHDDAIRAGAYTTDQHLISSLAFADDALTAWARKYPNDPQLARSYFLAFQMYRKVWTPEYQQKAWDYAHIVLDKWPSSYFGKALKKDLSIGYTEHYFATPVACATLDLLSPSPGARSATPSPTPQPTATPSPAPGQPKIDILPVPCYTPSPSPTPVVTATPSASASPGTSAKPSSTPSAKPSATPSPTASASPSSHPSPTATVKPTPTPTHKP